MRFLCKLIAGILLSSILFCACETDPVIYIDGPAVPVIYGIFDNFDTVHYLKVGKTFGAGKDPLLSANIYDSIYFEDIEVEVKITNPWNTTVEELDVTEVSDIPKDEGAFSFPGQVLYQFNYDFKYPLRFFGKVIVTAKVPDLAVARAEISMVTINRDSFSTPKFAQQYVYLTPTSPLRVHWFGNSWNEVDVTFQFIEDLGTNGQRSKIVHIQNTNSFMSPHPRYRELKIVYDEFIREVLLQIGQNDSVIETHLGYISVGINGGDHNMSMYKQYYSGFTDYNFSGYSNIENGLGLVASRTSILIDSMQFDLHTRKLLLSENKLKVLKLTK